MFTEVVNPPATLTLDLEAECVIEHAISRNKFSFSDGELRMNGDNSIAENGKPVFCVDNC